MTTPATAITTPTTMAIIEAVLRMCHPLLVPHSSARSSVESTYRDGPCSDAASPGRGELLDSSRAALLAPPRAISANGFASASAVFSRASSGCSTGGSDEYTVESLPLPFTPEPIPIYTPEKK